MGGGASRPSPRQSVDQIVVKSSQKAKQRQSISSTTTINNNNNNTEINEHVSQSSHKPHQDTTTSTTIPSNAIITTGIDNTNTNLWCNNNNDTNLEIEGKWQYTTVADIEPIPMTIVSTEALGSSMDSFWSDFTSEACERLERAMRLYIKGNPQQANCVSVVLGSRLGSVDLTIMRYVVRGGAVGGVRRVYRYPSEDTVAMQERARRQLLEVIDPFSDVYMGECSMRETNEETTDNNNNKDIDTVACETSGMFTTELHSVISAHNSPVFTVCFSLSGDTLLTGAKNGTMRHWEVATSYLVKEYDQLNDAVLSTTMSKTNSLIASGAGDYAVRLYNNVSRYPIHTFTGHDHKVYGVGFTSDGRQLVSGSMDKTVKLWDINKSCLVRSSKCHDKSIFSISVGNRSPWLMISASDDCTLASHDLRLSGDSTVTARYTGHTMTLWGCDIRYDDSQFISCGREGVVCVWDPRNPSAPLLSVDYNSSPVHCVEYLPDGVYFLSSTRDMAFMITEAATGEVCLTQEAHSSHVYRVSYNSISNRVVSVGSDSLVKLWSVKYR